MGTMHHATAKRATKLGVSLAIAGDDCVATCPDGATFSAPDFKGALEQAAKHIQAAIASGAKVAAPPKASKPKRKAAIKPDVGEDGEEEKLRSNGVVDVMYRDQYRERGGHCGDQLAQILSEALVDGEGNFDADAFRKVCDDNDIDHSRWAGRNFGMQRMNLSNVLRGRLKKGQTVEVLGRTVRSR